MSDVKKNYIRTFFENCKRLIHNNLPSFSFFFELANNQRVTSFRFILRKYTNKKSANSNNGWRTFLEFLLLFVSYGMVLNANPCDCSHSIALGKAYSSLSSLFNES